VSLQTFMMAIEPNNTSLADTNPGPTDDGYIAVAMKSVPQDPFCCSGPNKDDLGKQHYDLTCTFSDQGEKAEPRFNMACQTQTLILTCLATLLWL